jgi:hypothetical protein
LGDFGGGILERQVHGDLLDTGVVAFARSPMAAEVEEVSSLPLQELHVAFLGGGVAVSSLVAAAGERFLFGIACSGSPSRGADVSKRLFPRNGRS